MREERGGGEKNKRIRKGRPAKCVNVPSMHGLRQYEAPDPKPSPL